MKTVELLSRFQKENDEHLSKVFTVINDTNSFGWEKWLQIELMTFLAYDEGHSAEKERRLDFNKKSNPDRSYNLIDISYNEKYKSNHYHNAVEIKIGGSVRKIKSMIKDMANVSKTNNFKFRSISGVLFYKKQKKKTKYYKLIEHLIKNNYLIEINNFYGWEIAILEWSASKLQHASSKKCFKDYLIRIKDMVSECEVIVSGL